MKKIIMILCLLLCVGLISGFALTSVNAEEVQDEVVETNSIVGQVYTYEEDKNYTFTILDEKQVEVVATDKTDETQSVTIIMQYTYVDEILTVIMLDEIIGEFVIEENNTLRMYAPPKSDEETNTDVPEYIYPCKVVLSNIKNGTIEFSQSEGNVGDVVEIYNTPDLLYDLIEIKVNGNVLTPDEYGVYSFALIEGENIVTAKFEVSNEKLEKVAELLNQAKEGRWEEIFTVSNLMQLISWIITTLCSSGFFITLYKSRKFKQLTPLEISNQVNEKIDNVLSQDLQKFLKDVFGPFSEAMIEKFDKMDTSMKTLVRCFILMQENTPDARVTILKELETLNSNETNILTTQIKELIAEEVKKQEEKTKELDKTIEELKNETNTVSHL